MTSSVRPETSICFRDVIYYLEEVIEESNLRNMIEGKDPVLQAFLGTLMIWGLTALGAAMAFFIKGNQVTNELER